MKMMAQEQESREKEVITEDKLKDTEKEATALTEENHKLRREILMPNIN